MFNLSDVGALVKGNTVTFSIALPSMTAPAYSVNVMYIRKSEQFDKSVPAVSIPLAPVVPADNVWGQLGKNLWQSPPVTLTPGEAFLYRFEITGPSKENGSLVRSLYIGDPCATETANGIFSVVRVGQPAFVWKEPAGFKVPWITDAIIYEINIEAFNYGFDGIVDRLPHLRSLGVNVIELLPITGVAEPSSWGYTPIFYFAPEERFGGPEALKRMVQACHAAGIAVVMDMVLPHHDGLFPYEKAYERFFDLWYDNEYYDQNSRSIKRSPNPIVSEHERFGHKKDFRMASVQEFAQAVCDFWIREHHVDGFRYDHVNGLLDHAPAPNDERADWDRYRPTFVSLQVLTKHVYAYSKSFSRFQDAGGASRVIQIAEDLNEGAYQLGATADNAINGCWEERLYGYSTDMAVWNCVNGNYVDELLMKDRRWTNFTGFKSFGGDTLPVSPVIYNNCHDKSYLMYRVDRRTEWEQSSFEYPTGVDRMDWAKLQPYAIALLTSVGTPMLWMGEEMAESYGLPSGGSARVRGARFLHWENFYTPYDMPNVKSPVLPLTTLYRNLCDLRNNQPAMRGPGSNAVKEIEDFARKTVVYRRWLGADIFVLVINFSDMVCNIDVPFGHPGVWTDVLDKYYNPAAPFVANVSQNYTRVAIPSNFGRIFKLR